MNNDEILKKLDEKINEVDDELKQLNVEVNKEIIGDMSNESLEQIISKEKNDSVELMNSYSNLSKDYILLGKKVLDYSDQFKGTPEEWQSALDKFKLELNQINVQLDEKKKKYETLLNTYMNNNFFGASMLSKYNIDKVDKNTIIAELNTLYNGFKEKYNSDIENYKNIIELDISAAKKQLETTYSYVWDHSSSSMDPNVKPDDRYGKIYDEFQKLYRELLFKLETQALTINTIPEAIMRGYKGTISMLDKNYDMFKDLEHDMQQYGDLN